MRCRSAWRLGSRSPIGVRASQSQSRSGVEMLPSMTSGPAAKVKDSPAREGRNPATGAAMQIAASKKLTFSPANAVKDKLNG